MPAKPEDTRNSAPFRYNGAKRSLEVQIDADALARYRDGILELGDGIAATDGAQLAPWKLTFIFGAQ